VSKFRADVEGTRYYPTLGIEVGAGDVVNLPEDTVAAGLVPVADAPAKTKKQTIDETDASPDATDEGVTN
jgi:hypothetical protein